MKPDKSIETRDRFNGVKDSDPEQLDCLRHLSDFFTTGKLIHWTPTAGFFKNLIKNSFYLMARDLLGYRYQAINRQVI